MDERKSVLLTNHLTSLLRREEYILPVEYSIYLQTIHLRTSKICEGISSAYTIYLNISIEFNMHYRIGNLCI